MTEPLDELYLTWLYSQVGDVKVRNKSQTYWDLLRQMYAKQFVWLIPNDDNRIADGLDLRYEWAANCDISPPPNVSDEACSFLEVLIGLSRRLAFEGDGHPPVWFWHLIDNLGLLDCTDRPKYDQSEVNDRLDSVVLRLYEPDGRGGLFPLKHAKQDQRYVEIWYQMNEYLLNA